VKKTKYLVIGPLVSYNRGLNDIFLGFSNKKIGKDKQHERLIVSGEQRKNQYVYNYGHIYLSYTNFYRCIACRMIMEMDKFEVNDVHGADDLNIHNMNTLNNETKHGGNDTQFCNLSFI
jgi:hypothetical protein